jgi:hypothetical protein
MSDGVTVCFFFFLQNADNGNVKMGAAPVKHLCDTAVDMCMEAPPIKPPQVTVSDTAVDVWMEAPPIKPPQVRVSDTAVDVCMVAPTTERLLLVIL